MRGVRKPEPDWSLEAGTIIHKRYVIQKVLGFGGFGITYEVWDQKERCRAAMKEFMPQDVATRRAGSLIVESKPGQYQNYERFLKKFLKEAQLIYEYREHPNIVEIRHLFRENNTAYYIMEYLEGVDFGRLLKMWRNEASVPMACPWEKLIPIFSQVVEALSAIHENGLIHCDISPDNVFILKNGTVKLIDFGAAKNYIGDPTSMIFLKKAYAPPELYSANGRLGPWTDIYSLAVMIFFAYTGLMPPDALKRVNHDDFRVSQWLFLTKMDEPNKCWAGALDTALALKHGERFQDVKRFWNALNNINAKGSMVLQCTRGYYQGRRLIPEAEILFGTDASKCHMVFPKEYDKISPVHMRVWKLGDNLSNRGGFAAMDMGSAYGTFLNGERMTPGLLYALSAGDILQLGDRQIFQLITTEIS